MEIPCDSATNHNNNNNNKKSKSLKVQEFLPFPLEGGTISTDGLLTNFVAENFESKLKNSIVNCPVENSQQQQQQFCDDQERNSFLEKDKLKFNENLPITFGPPINERITAIKSQQQQQQQQSVTGTGTGPMTTTILTSSTSSASSSTSTASAASVSSSSSSSASSASASASASVSASASASSSSSTTSSYLIQKQFLLTNQLLMAAIDPNVLNDVEIESQYLAASVDSLTENLCNLLHSISSITADNVELYKNAVNKLTDCMDTNIKSMYTIMAKAEEITNLMKPTEALGQRIRDIKRLVDVFDSNI